jgi:hypothetical protein
VEDQIGRHPLFEARRMVDELGHTCKAFLEWEREHLLKREPTPDEQGRHRTALTWLLRTTRLLYTLARDPDFPDKSVLPELAHWLFQLEESWEAVYNPMPENEFSRLVAEHFPDNEPGIAEAH